jgi:hypothetical protein
MKATVGHLIQNYLLSTQTFIQAYLVNARQFTPLALTDVAHNLGAHSVACSYLIEGREVEALRREMGRRFSPFLREFLGTLDYPNCFERFLRERRVRLLHAHFGTVGCRALGLRRRLGIPLVTTFYGFDAAQWLRAPGIQETARIRARLLHPGSGRFRLIPVGCRRERSLAGLTCSRP